MHDIAQAAADAAQVPDFADVLARGRRRRNVRNGLAVGAATLAVAAIFGVTQVIGDNGGRDIEPAPGPTESRDVDTAHRGGTDDPVWIIDHADARIADAAVTPNGATAVFWRLVGPEPYGLAVTGDGFATRTEWRLPIAGDVIAAGDGFIVRDQALSKVWVVEPDGERRRVEVSGPVGPVGPGEVPVATSVDGLVAVDPETAMAHPVDTPEQAFDVESYGGRLSFVSNYIPASGQVESTYYWSDDGGASWETATFDAGPGGVPEVVPTPAGTEHVLTLTGDGGGSLLSVLTMPAAGGDFAATAYDGELTSVIGTFVVDGELRLFADLWGDGSGPPRESGLYRWVDGRLERITTGAPDVTDTQERTLVDVAATGDAPTLLVAVGAELHRSEDGGTTWETLPAR
jgi:hypothetical protein